MILLHRLLLACFLALQPLLAIASPPQDTEELITQGQKALAEGDAAQAALMFERVILDQPWRLGVWMDYALALQMTGDAESAQAIYRHLLTQNPPEHLHKWLEQQVQKNQPVVKSWTSLGSVIWLVGQDSNLNRAPTADTIALTFPSGSLDLHLTDNARAKAGIVSQQNVNWEALHHTEGGNDWTIQAGMSTRMVPGAKELGYVQPNWGITRHWKGASAGETLLTLAFQQLQYGGQDLQHILRAGLFRDQPWRAGRSSCSMLYGAEWKLLTYPSVDINNGHYLGTAAGLGCALEIGWNLLMHAGIDRAENQRASGDQQQIELRTQVYGRYGSNKWQVEANIARLRDTAGYSPLLNNNVVRDIQRGSLSLEYSYLLSNRLQILARVEVFRQNSSLPLFEMYGGAVWTGLSYSF